MQAVLLLPAIHLALLFLGYYRLRRLIESRNPLPGIVSSISEADAVQQAREHARIIDIAAEHGVYKATCLRRSLLLWWFLRIEGIQSDIGFGVRLLDRALQAHAWVECHGIVVNDSATVHEDYQVLSDVLPSTKLGL